MHGQDVEADILVTLEEALHGSNRQISFRRGATGKVHTYTVKIPKGVREGQRVRLAGLGETAGGRGQAGDLYLRIKFEKHPDFEVRGDDVYYELEIPVSKAVLGGDVEIPTLDGKAKLHVPPGAQTGQKFRLAGRGMPRKGGGRGDFYAVLQPILPRQLTSRERELWNQIASLETRTS
jgi:curved DNA-binding protein